MIRVLFVDDHPVVSAGSARLLEQAGGVRVIACADSADEAYSSYVADRPDVVVTDLSMPGPGGLELIQRVVARDAQARIVVFSMFDSPELLRRALDAGAIGYITKRSPPRLLLEAVREASAGRRFVGPDLAAAGVASGGPTDRARLEQLTEREFSLFRLLAQGHSLADCARLLHLSAKTVSNHQTQIRGKLGVSTSAALAHLAIRCGVISPAGE
jgi:DNA-binding NarL/FixJ family response regulator